MTAPSLLHEGATARRLGFLRAWVFGLWFVDMAKDPLPRLAELPPSYFRPVGLLTWLPSEAFSVLLSQSGLCVVWMALLLLLLLSGLGVRGYRAFALGACVLLTLALGLSFSFSQTRHAEVAALYVAYLVAVFPAADALRLARGPRASAPRATYALGMIGATFVLLSTYMLVGVRRMLDGGLEIFSDGTILRIIAQRASSPDHISASLGVRVLESQAAGALVEVGFLVVTFFELTSLLCLWVPWYRRCWLLVIVLFHLLSWPLLQTLFVHNLLLIGVLLVDFDGIGRRMGGPRQGVASESESPGSVGTRVDAR